MSEIQTTPLYLLFQSDNGERAYMPDSELVECGTPIDSNGDDMFYIGHTDNVEVASNWRSQ